MMSRDRSNPVIQKRSTKVEVIGIRIMSTSSAKQEVRGQDDTGGIGTS